MSQKELFVSIILRNDSQENWDASNYIPRQGEMIVYNEEEKELIKIGNGKDFAKSLPFFNNKRISKQIPEILEDGIEYYLDNISNLTLSYPNPPFECFLQLSFSEEMGGPPPGQFPRQ